MNKLETAKRLAKAHFQVEPHLKHIFVLKSLHDQDMKEPIRLLEVVEGTLERGFEPIAFAPDPANGINYPSMVIEVSPAEYKSARSGSSVHFGNHVWEIDEEVQRAS